MKTPNREQESYISKPKLPRAEVNSLCPRGKVQGDRECEMAREDMCRNAPEFQFCPLYQKWMHDVYGTELPTP